LYIFDFNPVLLNIIQTNEQIKFPYFSAIYHFWL
jgi:hypothetical protein